MVWWTADLHLGHKAIIKMQNRPFADVEEMNETIIANYNARVGKNDKVYILGDITHHLPEEEAMKMIKRLNGKKHLIIGNHDKIITPSGLFESCEMLTKVNDFNKIFWVCHYPLLAWHHMRSGTIMLHGHCHNTPEYNITNKENRLLRFDVGCDACNYMPINSKEIINFFGEEALNNPNCSDDTH